MFKSDGTRRNFPLGKNRIVIGRKVNCDLRIPLTSVSRQHCELLVDGDRVTVKDLGSSNGTYHNAVRVQEATLAAGDELTVGPVVFTLFVDGQPDEVKPVRTIVKSERSGSHAALAQQNSSAASSPPEESQTVAPKAKEEADVLEFSQDEAEGSSVVDDDPITALESLANNDESDEFDDIAFFLDDDDDDR